MAGVGAVGCGLRDYRIVNRWDAIIQYAAFAVGHKYTP